MNENVFASMLPLIQWPKGQESIKGTDKKYFLLNTDTYCVYTHVFKTAVSTIGMHIFPYLSSTILKINIFLPIIFCYSLTCSEWQRVGTGI